MVDSAVYDLDPERLNELAAMCFAAFHAAYGMRNARDGEQRHDDEKIKA